MSVFRDGVSRLADRTEREMAALFARFERGQIDRDQFVTLAAAIIAKARVQGVGLADLSLTADIIRQLRQGASPLGLQVPDGDYDSLRGSVSTVLDQQVNFEGDELKRSWLDRLRRLARDSSVEAAVWAYGTGMVAHGALGWIRVTDADPCPVCANLADGVVRGPHITMKRHKGCACTQAAAFREGVFR